MIGIGGDKAGSRIQRAALESAQFVVGVAQILCTTDANRIRQTFLLAAYGTAVAVFHRCAAQLSAVFRGRDSALAVIIIAEVRAVALASRYHPARKVIGVKGRAVLSEIPQLHKVPRQIVGIGEGGDFVDLLFHKAAEIVVNVADFRAVCAGHTLKIAVAVLIGIACQGGVPHPNGGGIHKGIKGKAVRCARGRANSDQVSCGIVGIRYLASPCGNLGKALGAVVGIACNVALGVGNALQKSLCRIVGIGKGVALVIGYRGKVISVILIGIACAQGAGSAFGNEDLRGRARGALQNKS